MWWESQTPERHLAKLNLGTAQTQRVTGKKFQQQTEPNLPVWTLFTLWGNVDLSQHFKSSDYFQFKFITLVPLLLTSSLRVQGHPMSRDQLGLQRHKVRRKNRFQRVSENKNKLYNPTETA